MVPGDGGEVEFTLYPDRLFEYQVVVESAAGKPLNYTLKMENGDPVPPSLGITIDLQSGLVSWTPKESQADQTYNLKVVVSDQTNTAEIPLILNLKPAEIAITYPPVPPLIVSADPIVATADRTFVYQPKLKVDAAGNRWCLLSWPEGMKIDPDTGEVTWTPSSNLVGKSRKVEVCVIDVFGGGAVQGFFMKVRGVNQLPCIENTFPRVWPLELFEFDVVAYDWDGDEIGYELRQLDENSTITIDQETGHINWNEPTPGQHAFVVRVYEKNEPSSYVEQPLNLYVEEEGVSVNREPNVENSPNGMYASIGKLFTFPLKVTDPDYPDDFNPGFTYEIVEGDLGEHMSIDSSGLFSWTPTEDEDSSHQITVGVTDLPPVDSGLAPETTYVTFTLTAVDNDPPRILSPSTVYPVKGKSSCTELRPSTTRATRN